MRYGARSLDRAAVGARIHDGGIHAPYAFGEAPRLLATEVAERRIVGLDHVAIAVGVAYEPDLCHTFDSDQKCGLERSHGPGEMCRAVCHG